MKFNKIASIFLVTIIVLLILVSLAFSAPHFGVTNFDAIHLSYSGGTATPILRVNQTGTGLIAEFLDNGTPVAQIADGGGLTLVTGNYDLDGNDLIIDSDGDSVLDENTDDNIRLTLGGATGTFSVLTGNAKIGNGTPDTTLNGEDGYVEGTFEVDGATRIDGGTTINNTLFVDAAADSATVRAQAHTTPTNPILTIEDSSATDVTTFMVAPASAGSADFIDVTDTLPILDGSDTVIGLDLNITGANHTGSGNTITGIDLDLTTADAQATEIAIELSDTDWDTGIQGALDLEHIGLPTVLSTDITYTAAAGGSGTVATITDGEIWFVHSVFIQVTTNFDATGDDATLVIGDGNDPNGFIDAADANLQTTFTEATGFTAGWYGIENGSAGAYTLDDGGPFVYAPSGADETIDWLVDETSGETLTAGEATIYVVYTRIQ